MLQETFLHEQEKDLPDQQQPGLRNSSPSQTAMLWGLSSPPWSLLSRSLCCFPLHARHSSSAHRHGLRLLGARIAAAMSPPGVPLLGQHLPRRAQPRQGDKRGCMPCPVSCPQPQR